MYKEMPDSWVNGLAGKDVSAQDFSGYDLTEINLQWSICRGCSFRDSMIAWANLSFADSTDADFTDAMISETDLRNSCFENAIMTNAWLIPVLAVPEQFTKSIGFPSCNANLYDPRTEPKKSEDD